MNQSIYFSKGMILFIAVILSSTIYLSGNDFFESVDSNKNSEFSTELSPKVSFMPCSGGVNEIGGTVYREFEFNGTSDVEDDYRNAELGMADVVINLYDDNQLLITSVMSDANGEWSADVTAATGDKVLIEFISPVEFISGPSGSNNVTSVKIGQKGTCDNDFTVGKIEDHCQDNPTIISACYPGPNDGDAATIVTIEFEESDDYTMDQNSYPPAAFTGPTASTDAVLASKSNTGFINGLAWDRTHAQVLSASTTKLSTVTTINNIGNIYTSTPAGITTLWLDLESIFPNVAGGDRFENGRLDEGFGPGQYPDPNDDPDVHNVGYIGFSDIEINDDDSEVYLYNARNRSVYVVQLDSLTGAAITTGIQVIEIPALCSGNNGNGYSYSVAGGLGFFDGRVYASTTCVGPSVNDLQGAVYSFDPSDAMPAPFQEFTIDYSTWEMPNVYVGGIAGFTGGTYLQNDLAAWADGLSAVNPFQQNSLTGAWVVGTGHSDFAPWAFDIEFDIHPNGNVGLNMITKNRATDATVTGNDPTNGGYITKASLTNTGTWELESNGDTGPFLTGLNKTVPADPLINIFQRGQDEASFYHGEGVEGPGANGGGVIIAGFKEFMCAYTDNYYGNFDSGFSFFDVNNGLKKRDVNILFGGLVGFAKGNSWGDLEALCDLPPIEIGNYVWIDIDKDGFQDPSESPQAGIDVELWKDTNDDGLGDLLLGTATTDGAGYYFFGGANNVNTSQELAPFMTYELRISLSDAQTTNSEIQQFTTPDATTDQFDSDFRDTVIAGNTWAYTTLQTTNQELVFHEFDAGFNLIPTVTITDTDITCGPVEEGGSISIETANFIGTPLTYDWNEDSYDGLTMLMNVPLGTYSVTVSDPEGNTATATAEITNEPCPPDPCTMGQLGGMVFLDANADGTDDGDGGIETVRVQLFACDNSGNSVLVETVYTDSEGGYYFTDPSIADGIDYRIEFSNLPQGFTSSKHGIDNGTATQFVNQINCDVDYGIINIAPIQIGNYVWIDANEDGIQDPCEEVVAGLNVKLYTQPSNGDTSLLVASTVTDMDGEYYFTDSTNVNEIWEPAFGSIEKDSSYYVVFCGDAYNDSLNVIRHDGNLFEVTIQDIGMGMCPDKNDSDVAELSVNGIGDVPAISITADTTNHTFDLGLLPKPDVALMMVVDPDFDDSNLAYGDSVKFKITVINQSLLSVDSMELINYLPSGYSFDPNFSINQEWDVDLNGNLTTTLNQALATGEKDSICLFLTLEPTDNPQNWVTISEITAAYQNGVVVEDCDSPLNNDPDDNGGNQLFTPSDNYLDGDGSALGESPIDSTDQDNVDPAAVAVCDLALINIIDEIPSSLKIGDTIKYSIIVENQGTVPANNIDIQYYIPEGLTYLDTNNVITPVWVSDTSGADLTLIDTLYLGEFDTVCIYLAVDNVDNANVSSNDWTTFAEISAFQDPNDPGVDKTDFDSTPDDVLTNDNGGNPDDLTDNETSGNGLGDPNIPAEDMDPALDEDDHDPAKIEVCDVATQIYLEDIGPFEYLDTAQFKVVVYNQGNDTITNVKLNDILGSGLEFINTGTNTSEAWSGDNDLITTTTTDEIPPGESDTICLDLQIVSILNYDSLAYVQFVEIEEFEDPDTPGVIKEDIDSNPDAIDGNDPGGNPNDPTDDEIDGDGTGNPDSLLQDTNALLDEDDHDPVLVPIFDLALDKKVSGSAPSYSPGDTATFDITIYNQGNTPAEIITITDYLREGFDFLPDINTGWNVVGDSLEYNYTNTLLPDSNVTISLALEVVIPAMPTGVTDWWNYAEISYADDNTNMNDTPPGDADSTPDGNDSNDNPVEPDDAEDDEINQNGKDGEDEDDHDPAKIVVGFDLALDKVVSPAGPYKYGDTLNYAITVYNQGGLTATDIAVYDTIPCGLIFDPTLNPTWEFNNNVAIDTILGPLASAEQSTLNIFLVVGQCAIPSSSNYYNVAEISSFLDEDGLIPSTGDIDSNPDDDPTNDGNPVDNEINQNSNSGGDEDDHDFEDIDICDLALTNKIVSIPITPEPGDTLKFEVVVYNQGNSTANSADVNYYIPKGYDALPINQTLSPMWTDDNDSINSITTDKVLFPGDRDTVCIYLELQTVSTEDASENAWTTLAEITSFTDGVGDIKMDDADSTPDNDPNNDSGGNPDDLTDDEIAGNGQGDPNDPLEDSNPMLDEDDHDPTIIYICDIASIIDTEETGPFSYGDTLKYFVEVHNQGNGPITNINVQNLFGEGLNYVVNTENSAEGWMLDTIGTLGLLISDTLEAGEIDTICLYMEVIPDYESSDESWLQNVEIVSFEDADNPGVPKTDIDSTPDDDPDNDSGGNPDDPTDDTTDGNGDGDPNDPIEDEDPTLDEDDQDVEDIEICDLALINQIVEINDPIQVGDTIKYEVIVFNQGNRDANTVSVDYQIPNGLAYLPLNNGLSPVWLEENSTLASITTDSILSPGESDTLCIYLALLNLPSDEVTSESWTTTAEITELTNEDDVVKTTDIDSDPNDDPTDDGGGNTDDDTDNEVEGDGSSNPLDPLEDMDPTKDEDDHDREIVLVCDVATIINTEAIGPFSYGDTLKYFVEIHNQGNGPITNIDIQNLFGEGLSYVANTENTSEGWVLDTVGELSLLFVDTLEIGEIDTICLYMEVIPDYESSDESWLQNVEIVSFEDADNPGVPKTDIDSTPDDDPDNDSGGNPDDPTDDTTDGNGDGDPNDPIEDEDPTLDEDDQDVEDIEICDLALINQIVEINDPIQVGDTIKYEVIVFNQGNRDANTVSVDYQIPNGLAYLPLNNGLSPVWLEEGSTLASITTDSILSPGESDTLCIYLALLNLPSDEVTSESWTTTAEITALTNEDDVVKTTDIDSDPNDDPTDDGGGNTDDDTDNEVEGDGSSNPLDPLEDMDPTKDEDDHDREIVLVCDVATIINTEAIGPFSYGDTLKYFVEVHNQGNGPITNIDIQNLFGEGLSYVANTENTSEGWVLDTVGELSLLFVDTLEIGEIDTICLYMEVIPDYESSEESWLQNVEIVSFEDPDNPGVPKTDIDSTPDDDPDNDSGGNADDTTDDTTNGNGDGDPNDPIEDEDPTLDEDDQDVEDIEICDLALINQIADINNPLNEGDTVKFEVVLINQGNSNTNSVSVDYQIPNGLSYLPLNNGLSPMWSEESDFLASLTTDSILFPGESDTVCLYLLVMNLPTNEVIQGSWTTTAEITQFTDTDDVVKIEDVDSTPDDDPTNDGGGNTDDETDNEVEGDGTSDPLDPLEDADPTKDQDDHDREIVLLCDIATIIDTDEIGPFSYGDTLKYFIEVHNQGNGPITNVDVQNLYGEGLAFLNNTENTSAGWLMDSAGYLSLLLTDTIELGQIDTICLFMELVPDFESSEDSWLQNVEIVSFEDPDNPGVPKTDIDSTPDDDPDNDSGGNPDDTTDDVTDGNGDGDPNDPIEDEDPTLDEDDQDVEDINICDLALVNRIVDIPTAPNFGDTLKYEIIIINQGNTITNGVSIDYQIPEGLGYLPVNNSLDPMWTEDTTSLASVSTVEPILPGNSDTICFYLEITDLPTSNAMDESWVTIAEITGFTDENDQAKLEDVDSTPDDDPENDSGGNYDDETDDFVEGSGNGDPMNPIEDSDPALDEDDHDPTNLFVCDVAVIINTDDEGPFEYGDTIKYFVEVHNQGNGEITNVDLQNLYGEGLVYLETAENIEAGWVQDSVGELSNLYDEILMPGMIDTICVSFEIIQDVTPDLNTWLTSVEVVSFEDPLNPGVPKHDVDSTPDNDPTNDSGGNPFDDTDDETSGNGTGDPLDSMDDQDPMLDEDDQDVEILRIYDLALTKKLAFPDSIYLFGTEIEFDIIIQNQGNIPTTDILITEYVPASLTDVGVMGDNTGWNFGTPNAEFLYTDTLASAGIDTIKLFMIFQPAALLEDYINVAEITEFADTSGNNSTDNPDVIKDADSDPDNMEGNDSGGQPDFPGNSSGTDDVVDNSNDDEDDQDPVLLGFVDLALVKVANQQQVDPGEEIQFTITLTNQGTIPAEEVHIVDYIPQGMILMDTDWTEGTDGSTGLSATTILSSIDGSLPASGLQYDQSVDVILTLLVDANTLPGAYSNYAEIDSVFGAQDTDMTDLDIDSTPDNDDTNDSGGSPETYSDDAIDGNGTFGGGTPLDENPETDEDDQDPAGFCVTPRPVIIGDAFVCPSDTMIYTVRPYNPDNTYEWGLTQGGVIIAASDSTVTVAWNEEDGGPHQLSIHEYTQFQFCYGFGFMNVIIEGDVTMSCNSGINISLDQQCQATITADMMLEASPYPDDSYTVVITDESGFVLPSNVITADYIGQQLEIQVIHDCTGNSCWGYITVEDKLAPVIICPANDTLTCNEYANFQVLNPALENGGCGNETIEITTDEQIGGCDDEFAYIFTITSVATDQSGNVSDPCVQVIFVEKESIDSLDFPPHYDGIGDNEDPLSCDGTYDLDESGHPSTNVTGMPGGLGSCINVTATYSDVVLPLCETANCNTNETSYKIIRSWVVVEWCTSTIVDYVQVIKILDEKAPEITVIPDMTVSTDIWGCAATIELPNVSATDNCSADESITYTYSSTAGTQIGNTFVLTSPAKTMAGNPVVITVTATDCCGNSSSTDFNVTVVDLIPPIVVAETSHTVSLANNGVAKIFAEDFDDGSYDGCGPVGFSAKRMDNGPNCNYDEFPPVGNDNAQFNEAVFFCCEDVSDEPIMVQFQVCDDANMDAIIGNSGDNCNLAMVEVYVQDKLAPQIICPDPMTISCIDLAGLDLTDLDLLDGLFGTAEAAGTCNVGITQTVVGTENCGAGVIFRNFTATNNGGTSSCQQIITVEAGPENVLTCDRISFVDLNNNIYDWCAVNDNQNDPDDDLPAIMIDCTDGLEIPELNFDIDGLCTEVGLSITVDTFDFAGGACKKYIIHYEVIDHCVFDENYVDPATGEINPYTSNNGYFEFNIEVDAFDNEAPVLDCEDISVVATSCTGYDGSISISGMDNCTDPSFFGRQWRIDLNADNTIDFPLNGWVATSNITPAQIGLTEFPIGTHRIFWLVSDGCGNDATCSQLVTITGEDKAPTPYCFDGLSVAVMPSTGTVALWANDFDAGSFDNCGGTLILSMIPEQDVTGLDVQASYDQSFNHSNVTQQANGDWGFEFDCSYIPNGVSAELEVKIYVTDEDGNYDYCVASLRIDDNFDACEDDDTGMLTISGEMRTEEGDQIELVDVELDANYPEFPQSELTIEDGLYVFNNLFGNVDYKVTPLRDDNHLNGVSTLDIVMMQKHILGLDIIESPYKLIAADVNSDCQVTGQDLVQLRKLILGKYENDMLPENTSWRFVKDEFEFIDGIQPCQYDELASLSNLDESAIEDFFGIKIGDINGTVQANLLSPAESRTSKKLELQIQDRLLRNGQGFKIPIRASDFTEIYGFQFTLNMDKLEFQEIESGEIKLSMNNVHVKNNSVSVAIALPNETSIEDEAILFYLHVKAKEAIKLSETLEIISESSERMVSPEAYYGERLEIVRPIIRFRNGKEDLEQKEFVLYQNEPNPFKEQTIIRFELPTTAETTLTIYNVSGQEIYKKTDIYAEGENSIIVRSIQSRDTDETPITGVLYYELKSGDFVATKKMIIIE